MVVEIAVMQFYFQVREKRKQAGHLHMTESLKHFVLCALTIFEMAQLISPAQLPTQGPSPSSYQVRSLQLVSLEILLLLGSKVPSGSMVFQKILKLCPIS